MYKMRKMSAVMVIFAMAATSLYAGDVSGTEAVAAGTVKLSKTKLNLKVGKTSVLKLKNISKKNAKKAKWTSSKKKVASVSFNKQSLKATVKAKAPGTAKIRAKVGKKKYTCTVKVTRKNQELMMLKNTYVTYVGGAVGVRPAVVGTDKLDTSALTYTSSNKKVARVIGKTGVVKGVSEGTAKITIKTSNNKKLTATVKVYKDRTNIDEKDSLYEAERTKRLKELKELGIDIDPSKEAYSGYEQVTDEVDDNIDAIVDEYRKQSSSAFADNTPEDVLYSIISVYDENEETKAAKIRAGISGALKELDEANNVIKLIEASNNLLADGERGLFGIDISIMMTEGKGNEITYVVRPSVPAFQRLSSRSEFDNTSSEKYKALEAVVYETLKICGESDEEIKKNVPIVMKGLRLMTPEKSQTDILKEANSEKEFNALMAKYGYNSAVPYVRDLNTSFTWLRPATALTRLGIKPNTFVYIPLSAYFMNIEELLETQDVEMIRQIIKFNYAYGYAFKTLSGYKAAVRYNELMSDAVNKKTDAEIEADYENRAIDEMRSTFAWDLTDVYSEKYLTKEVHDDIEEYVKNVVEGYKSAIANCPWMSESTREGALDKINNINYELFKPDDMSEYVTGVDLKSASEGGDIYSNVNSAKGDILRANVKKYGVIETAKEAGWGYVKYDDLSPMDANAFYLAPSNSFKILAGIISDESYHKNDDVYNYGKIGFAIGHEIGHAFDNKGSRYNKDGELKKWISSEDEEKYKAITDKIIKLAENYSVYYDKAKEIIYYQDGKKTLDENMADISGVEIVKNVVKEKYGAEALKEYFRQQTRFWMDDRYTLEQYSEDEHGAPGLRGDLPVQMMDEFYDVFGIKNGDAEYIAPQNRTRIWS